MRILISKPDSLGDQFIAAGAVQALQRLRPEMIIVWHVRAGMEVFAPLIGAAVFKPDTTATPESEAARLTAQAGTLIALPYPLSPDEEWTNDVRHRVRWWGAFLKATSWDASILAQVNRNWVGDFTVALAPAPVRIGFSAGASRQPLMNEAGALAGATAPEFTDALEPSFTRPESAQIRDLLAAIEPGLTPAPVWQPEEMWQVRGQPVEHPRVLIAPGVGGDPRRAWGIQNFLEIAAALRSRGAAVLWIEGPGDAGYLDALPDAESANRIRIGPDDLSNLVREMGSADLLICHDTAYVHIAAGVGVPTVAIFGAGQEARFHPQAGRVKVVQGRIACSGCQWHCLWDRLACVADIPVQFVLTAVEQMLAGDSTGITIPLASPVADAQGGERSAITRRLQEEVLTLNADRFARLQIIQSLLAQPTSPPPAPPSVGAAAPPPRPETISQRGEGAASPFDPNAPEVLPASSNISTFEPSNLSTFEPSNVQTCQPANPPTSPPSHLRTSQPSHLPTFPPSHSVPRVSVIIPMGRPERVTATLASIAGQATGTEGWEIILVGVEAESVARSHPHLPIVPVVLEKNLLPPRTRCLGVERATGEWLLFLDDDVELAPDCGARFTGLLETPPFAADVSPPVGAIGFRLPGKSGRFFERLTDISNFWAQQHGTAEDRDWLYSAALLVRADAYRRSGGFNPELPNGEDVDLTRRIAAAGFRLRYEPALVARHDHRRDTLFSMWRYFWRNGNAARYFFAAHGGACPFSIKTVWLKAWSDLAMNRDFQRRRGISLGLRTPFIWLNYLIVETSLDWHWQKHLHEERRYRTLPAPTPADATYVHAMTDWDEDREITGVFRYAWAMLQDFDNPVRR